MDLYDLIKRVEEWGDSHNLHDPIMQYAKVNEEIGEIAHELTRNRLDSVELQDAIGDSLVTLIILAHQLDININEALEMAYLEIADRKGKTENGSFVKES